MCSNLYCDVMLNIKYLSSLLVELLLLIWCSLFFQQGSKTLLFCFHTLFIFDEKRIERSMTSRDQALPIIKTLNPMQAYHFLTLFDQVIVMNPILVFDFVSYRIFIPQFAKWSQNPSVCFINWSMTNLIVCSLTYRPIVLVKVVILFFES